MSTNDNPPVLSEGTRVKRLSFILFISLLVLFLAGLWGFKNIVKLDWIDAVHNTSFYMAGMGPVAVMKTPGQKIFASVYGFFAGLLFVGIAVYIIDAIADLTILKGLD